MLVSMTGYGKSQIEVSGKTITIEIKSLNSKQLDLNVKLSTLYREKELEIRNLITEKLVRGKIDCLIYIEQDQSENTPLVNKEVVINYYNQICNIQKELGINDIEKVFPHILKLPDALKTTKEELNDTEWKEINKGLQNAIASLVNFRLQEGKAMQEDILNRINHITSAIESITPFEENRISKIKARLVENFNQTLQSGDVDKNRFEQELIFYLEKLDITEEKVRLKNHCKYFIDTLNMNDPVGKKLGFITQEIGREINTIGSKANDSDIQRIVVEMKNELEKIKEQILNTL